MNTKNYSLVFACFIAICLTACTNNTNKGHLMIIKIGSILDLSLFKTQQDTSIKYAIIKEGNGKKPSHNQTVTVHYSGWLLQGANIVGPKFDSSVDRGQYFKFLLGIGQVIKGWDLSVTDMTIGEKRIVILPSNLAYGSSSVGQIPANATLIFEIELFATN